MYFIWLSVSVSVQRTPKTPCAKHTLELGVCYTQLLRSVQSTLQKRGVLSTLESGVLRDTDLAHHFRCAIATLFLKVQYLYLISR